jgi:hypothetical protein
MSCQRQGARNEPLLEFLIDRHHFDILVLLHIIPGGGVGLGPHDYSVRIWLFEK